jgi:hypothetical protein|tara:strand:+ start:654 stop:1406 length:753 start_codon:yes stop_codon:yes gene_type:complete
MSGVIQVGIVGRPSTGKSYSIRNLDPKTTFIITPNKKDLPFRGSAAKYQFLSKKSPKGNRGYCKLLAAVEDEDGKILQKGLIDWIKYVNDKRPEIKTIVIEDITHFFHARTQEISFRKSKDWGKWGDFAADVLNAIIDPDLYRDGVRVVHIYHSEVVEQAGEQISRIMTQGKALNNKILPSSYYTYMLHTKVLHTDEADDPAEQFWFITNPYDGHDCKSSYGCFPLLVKNDLNSVLDKIEKYRSDESPEE